MISAAQHAAFTGATLGVPMSSFQSAILMIFYSVIYLWATWVMVTQWRAWGEQKITFYHLLTRAVRAVLVTVVAGFFLL